MLCREHSKEPREAQLFIARNIVLKRELCDSHHSLSALRLQISRINMLRQLRTPPNAGQTRVDH